MLIAQSFFIATVISHFHCYSAQPFLMQKELSHFSMVQYLVIFHYYSTQPFSTAIVLIRSSLLQCVRQLNHFAK
jgi:hypothetical protein